MSSKRPLTLPFINRLDRYLLLHKPVLWTTRAHLVAWYAVLFSIVLATLCFLVPDNPVADSNSFVWTTLTGVLSFLGLIVWIIYLLRFNVFKRFGDNGKLDAVKNFTLFFLVAGFLIAPAYIPTAIESARANAAFGNEEVVNDINAINIKVNQLEYDSLNHNWAKESYIVRDSVDRRVLYRQNDDAYIVDGSSYIDTSELRNKMLEKDSVVRENDSMYHFYTCPKYTFLQDHYSDLYTKGKVKKDIEIYRELIRNFRPANKTEVEKELKALINKYSFGTYSYYSDELDTYNPSAKRSYFDAIYKRYNLYRADNGLSNLIEKKYRWYTGNESRFRIWFYLSFILALFVFIFRHSTVKAFFLSILTCVVLLVLTALLLAFSRNNDIEAVYIFCLIYYLLFIAGAFIGNSRKIRGTITGISLNIVTFFTFLIPIIAVQLYYEGQDKLYRINDNFPTGYHETKNNVELFTEIGSIVLFLILLQPGFKRLYRSWFAKPEQ
jgi:hypothetical protein